MVFNQRPFAHIDISNIRRHSGHGRMCVCVWGGAISLRGYRARLLLNIQKCTGQQRIICFRISTTPDHGFYVLVNHTPPPSQEILIKLSKRGLLGRRGFRGTGKITSRRWGRGSEVDQWLKMLPARPDSLTMGSHTVEGQNWFPPIILRQPTHTLTHTSTHEFNNKCKTVLFQKRVVGVNRLKPHYMYDKIVRE